MASKLVSIASSDTIRAPVAGRDYGQSPSQPWRLGRGDGRGGSESVSVEEVEGHLAPDLVDVEIAHDTISGLAALHALAAKGDEWEPIHVQEVRAPQHVVTQHAAGLQARRPDRRLNRPLARVLPVDAHRGVKLFEQACHADRAQVGTRPLHLRVHTAEKPPHGSAFPG